MKILQFTPPPAKPDTPGPGRRPETGDFAALLKRSQTSGTTEDPDGLVRLENRRARQLPPAGELKEAGRLLGRLDQDIRSAPPEALSRVHSLEGLLCVFRKTPGAGGPWTP
jgi:hypothetical protein